MFHLASCVATLFGLCVVGVVGERIARWWKAEGQLKRYKRHEP